MFKKILNFIFPETYSCLGCGRDVFDNPYLFCSHCIDKLPFITEKVCIRCGDILENQGYYCKRCKGRTITFDRAISCFKYDGKIKTLIHSLKFDKAKYVALSLSKFLADVFINEKLYANIIIPVPLCDKRLKQRGYNQSKILADELSKHLKLKVKDNLLKRVKETPNQTELNFNQRQVNLLDAFKVVNSKEIKDKAVLLIDDIYTTGATARECSKVLRKAGAKAIYVLTVGHTILKNESGEN